MADEEDVPRCKVTYIDLPEGATEETNWIKRAGKCQVVYPNGGHTFEGKRRHNDKRSPHATVDRTCEFLRRALCRWRTVDRGG
jgi:hypothetical protein